MNTKGVEDGIVCEFCGTHCYRGAEHNARVEDNARFDDAKPTKPSAAVPVEERTLRKTCYCNEIWCPTCYPPVPTAKPIPEERTAEMEQLCERMRWAVEKLKKARQPGMSIVLCQAVDEVIKAFIEGTPK